MSRVGNKCGGSGEDKKVLTHIREPTSRQAHSSTTHEHTSHDQHFSLYAILVIFSGLILVIATFISHTVAALIILPLVFNVGNGLEPEPHPNLLVMAGVLMAGNLAGVNGPQRLHDTPMSQQLRRANRARIRDMGAELGFAFRTDGQSRIYNTFDAHRLLHWAGLEGLQYNLKEALFKAYFTDGQDPSDHATLAIIAESVGLDIKRAAEILASDEYAAEVREQEQLWISRGVSSVPTIVFNDQYAVSGGQPAEAFVGAIRQIINDAKN